LKFSTKSKGASHAKCLVFVDKNLQSTTCERKVTVVLSPEFYWFREEMLPAKNEQQAKRLAPSVFDAILPATEYSYMAIKKEDFFWLFAYDDEKIIDVLDRLGIRPNQVSAIYFAQTESDTLESPLRINEDYALVKNEHIVSLVPLKYVGETVDVNEFFTSSPRSNHKVNVNFFQNSLLDEKQINQLTMVTIVLLIIYFANFMYERHSNREARIEQKAIVQQYALPQTSFERKALMRSLHAKDKRQRDLRQHVKALLKIPLASGEYIKSFDLKIKKVDYVIVLKSEKNAEKIKKALEKLYK